MRRLAAISFAAVTLLATAARAQEYSDDVCPVKPAAEKRAQRWAGRWFAKGEQASRESRFQEALDAFLCSLYLYPHQNTVFNVAQLTNLVEDKALAAASIRKFREDHPGGEFDDELSELVVSLEKAMGIEQPEPAPEPAPEAQPAPAPEVEVPPALANDGAAGEAKSAPGGRGKALRNAGFAVVGAAGATLVVGIILQAMAGAAKTDAEDAASYDAFQKNEDDMKGRQAGATAMFVVTGALAATGALMVVLGKRKERAEGDPKAEVSVAPGPGGVVMTGRF